ncbi:MAG: hypothetical protein IIA89_14280 [Chloroflexi bacterium]|nr:hypothetical protein [Chloroflexota bacterium]
MDRDDEKKQDQLRALARWLAIAPLILLLLYGCGTLALVGFPTSVADTRSQLQADYSPWPFMAFQPISPEILEEIRRDQARYPESFDEPVAFIVPGEFWPPPQTLAGGGPTPIPLAIASPSPTSTATWLPTQTLAPTPTKIPSVTPTSSATLPPTPSPTRPPERPTPTAPEASGGVTVCHNPGPKQETKVLDPDVVNGHLGHGDYLGECN